MRSLLLGAFAFAVALEVSADQSPTPAITSSTGSPAATPTASATSAPPTIAKQDLTGLWEAKLRFGPDVRGTLLFRGNDRRLSAEIAGHSAEVKVAGDAVAFELFDGKNAFRGNFIDARARIV